MFTLKIFEKCTTLHAQTRKDIPLQHAFSMARKGGFFKVQIIDQSDDSIYLETINGK